MSVRAEWTYDDEQEAYLYLSTALGIEHFTGFETNEDAQIAMEKELERYR
jgi:hypothetical protein